MEYFFVAVALRTTVGVCTGIFTTVSTSSSIESKVLGAVG